MQSEDLGRFSTNLGFEIWSGDSPQAFTLPVMGVCDHPHISSDYRNVFFRKVRDAHTHTHIHMQRESR